MILILIVLLVQKSVERVPDSSNYIKNQLFDNINIFNLNLQNFDDLTQFNLTQHQKWGILFYHPLCHHCQIFAPTWSDIGNELSQDMNIGAVDCSQQIDLQNRFQINAYPSIYLFNHGQQYLYKGNQSKQDVKLFLEIKYQDQVSQNISMSYDIEWKKNNYNSLKLIGSLIVIVLLLMCTVEYFSSQINTEYQEQQAVEFVEIESQNDSLQCNKLDISEHIETSDKIEIK